MTISPEIANMINRYRVSDTKILCAIGTKDKNRMKKAAYTYKDYIEKFKVYMSKSKISLWR